MSDDTTNGSSREFLLLETQMQRGASMPPPAELPKIPKCGYCGIPLSSDEKGCIFCPAREEDLEPEDLPENPGDAAAFLGLRNRVPTP